MNREAELDVLASEIDKEQDHRKGFKSAKAMKRRDFDNPYVTDESNKWITNQQIM